ncbi:Zinc transporter 6-A [Fasciola hepatica]|uniref:Zinc transporter 6-A n=1 Tax=Fasciola hepatica TaxID=6192 RepID=A0A4E0RIX0_FASHE|nr:Zinc transporter 6-A [Fasciola hepatica]
MKFLDQIWQSIQADLCTLCSLLTYSLSEAKHLISVEPRTHRIVGIGFLVGFCLLLLLVACNASNSLTLTAFAHLLIFDLLYIVVALTSLWTKRKSASLDGYTLGYERFEVVAVFSVTILAMSSSFFEIKEAVERFFEPSHVHVNFLLAASLLALFVHVVAIYGVENPAFNHVILASGSSWLQEHTTDISHTLCRIVPGLARILLPRVNPFALVGVCAASVVGAVYWVMSGAQDTEAVHAFHGHSGPHDHSPNPMPDTVGGMIISLMLFGTMVPMMLYSGRILLQTVPAHLVGPLDKAFREASTVDGVLELRNEHVWSVGFGNLAGSLYVRVRRDANEQLVLAHVHNRLSSLVKYLTVQVYKDDWTRGSSTFHWPPVPMALPNNTPQFRAHTPLKQDHFNVPHASVVPGMLSTTNRPTTDQGQWCGLGKNRSVNNTSALPDLLDVIPQPVRPDENKHSSLI